MDVLEHDRRDRPDLSVRTTMKVEQVDEPRAPDLLVFDGFKWSVVPDRLGPERRFEGLRESIVIRVPRRTDRGDNPGRRQPVGATHSDELDSYVPVVP